MAQIMGNQRPVDSGDSHESLLNTKRINSARFSEILGFANCTCANPTLKVSWTCQEIPGDVLGKWEQFWVWGVEGNSEVQRSQSTRCYVPGAQTAKSCNIFRVETAENSTIMLQTGSRGNSKTLQNKMPASSEKQPARNSVYALLDVRISIFVKNVAKWWG